MGIFDALFNLKSKAVNKARAAMSPKETFKFEKLPETVEELKAMPEAAMDSPYKTAALTVCALCAYAKNRETGKEMLNFLRGPRPLSGMDVSFLNDRFMDGQDYVPRSFFDGASPANDYTPNVPYVLTVKSNQYSDDNKNYKKLFVQSGGADSLRAIIMRLGADNKWYLWEQELLAGIRQKQSENPWA